MWLVYDHNEDNNDVDPPDKAIRTSMLCFYLDKSITWLTQTDSARHHSHSVDWTSGLKELTRFVCCHSPHTEIYVYAKYPIDTLVWPLHYFVSHSVRRFQHGTRNPVIGLADLHIYVYTKAKCFCVEINFNRLSILIVRRRLLLLLLSSMFSVHTFDKFVCNYSLCKPFRYLSTTIIETNTPTTRCLFTRKPVSFSHKISYILYIIYFSPFHDQPTPYT